MEQVVEDNHDSSDLSELSGSDSESESEEEVTEETEIEETVTEDTVTEDTDKIEEDQEETEQQEEEEEEPTEESKIIIEETPLDVPDVEEDSSRDPSTEEESDRSRGTETEEEEPSDSKPVSTVTPRKKVSFTFQSTPNTPTSTGGILKRNGTPVDTQFSRENLKSALANASKKLTQTNQLGGPDDSGFGDGGQRFSIYSSLNSCLRVDVSPDDMKCLASHARVLSECAKNDIMTADSSKNALDTRVVIQAVRFLAYLLVDQNVAETVDPEIVSWVVNQGLSKIADATCSKSVLGGYLHLLSHHRVCKNVVTAETTLLLYTELSKSEKKSSTALTSEVLSIYQTVAVVHPARALQHVSLWLPRVLCLALDGRSGLRSQAISVLSDFIVAAGPNSKGLTAKSIRILSSPFSLEIARGEGAQLPAWLKPKDTFAETILQAATDCPSEDPLYELWGLTLLMAPMDAESSIHAWTMLPSWLGVPANSTLSVALLKACRYVVHTHTRKHLVKYPVGLQSLATRSGNTLLLCIQPLGLCNSQLVDQQCLSLFNQTLNTLLVPLETNQLTLKANSLMWDSYIRPTLAVMATIPSLANVACASLACLLRFDQKVQKDREPVFSTSIRQLVTSLSPRWVKSNYDKIIEVVKTIPLDTSGPNFQAVWTALVNNISHSAAREIHPSGETSGFIMSAARLHRHMTSKTNLDNKAFYLSVFGVAGLVHCIDKVIDGTTAAAYMFETLVEANNLPEAKKYLQHIYMNIPSAARRFQFTQSVASIAHTHEGLYKLVLDKTGEDINGPEMSNLSPKGIYTILASPNRPDYPDTWMSILRSATEMIRKDAFLGSTQEVLIEPLLQVIDESLQQQVVLHGIEVIDKKPRPTASASSPMFRGALTTDLPKDFTNLGAVACKIASQEIITAVKTCLNTLPDHSMPCFFYRFAPLVVRAIASTPEQHRKYLCDSIVRKLRNGPILNTKVYTDLLVTQVFPAWFNKYQDDLKKKQTNVVGLWNELCGNNPEITLEEPVLNMLTQKFVSARQDVYYQGDKLEKHKSRKTPSASPNVSPIKRKSMDVLELDETPRRKSKRVCASPVKTSPVKPSPLRRNSPRLEVVKMEPEPEPEEEMTVSTAPNLTELASQTNMAIDLLNDGGQQMSVKEIEQVESALIGALFKLNQLKQSQL